MREIVALEQVQQLGDGFVLVDAKQVGGAANAERCQFGQRSAGAEVDAELRQSSLLVWGRQSRMVTRMLRSEQNHQFVAGAADVSGADGKNGIAGLGFFQQKLDGFLHGT